MRLRGTVLDVWENEESVEVTVRSTTPSGTVSCTTLTVDPSQGWCVTSYVTEANVGGTQYTMKGYTSPARFGDVWFPVWSRHEQYRNGEFDWAREYYVLEAEFNVPLCADTFTWAGLGIKPESLIFDHTTGRHLYWTGSESIPYSGERRQDSRSRVPTVPTAPAARSAVPVGSAALLGALALGVAYALRALRRRT
jgi:hypothetical protein